MPTFTFRPLTRTSYRVVDAQTGEEYGTVRDYRETDAPMGWGFICPGPDSGYGFATRTEAAEAVYRVRHAHGFEMGAL